jgi:hypothetical protein
MLARRADNGRRVHELLMRKSVVRANRISDPNSCGTFCEGSKYPSLISLERHFDVSIIYVTAAERRKSEQKGGVEVSERQRRRTGN